MTSPDEQLSRWTPEHQKIAVAQGWDMFDVDTTGNLEIERCDETARFESDLEAVEFVKAQAQAGDETAKLALELDAYFKPSLDDYRAGSRAMKR